MTSAAQQAVEADGRDSSRPAPSPSRPWWSTTGSLVTTCYRCGFLMRPLLNGGTLGGPASMGILDKLFKRTPHSGSSPERDGPSGAPELVAIDHDDYHAEHVGHTADGRQFFLTTPFLPGFGADRPGCEFIALYLFDAQGRLLDAKIDSLGPRATMDEEHRRGLRDQRLLELGEVTFDRIEVRPFSVERFGTEFGLVPSEVEDDPGVWTVELLPGNYMAFWEPWDSGVYDT